MKTPEQIPVMAPIEGYEPDKDWSPGVPEHLVDELTGKPIGTHCKGGRRSAPPHNYPKQCTAVAVEHGYPALWVKKEK